MIQPPVGRSGVCHAVAVAGTPVKGSACLMFGVSATTAMQWELTCNPLQSVFGSDWSAGARLGHALSICPATIVDMRIAVALLQDQPLKGADPVLWYSFGVTHLPRLEDFPVRGGGGLGWM